MTPESQQRRIAYLEKLLSKRKHGPTEGPTDLTYLRPFLLITTCLLGACDEKDAAPGSHLPDTASTKSSHRETRRAESEFLATRQHRSGSYPAGLHVMVVIDRYFHDPDVGPETKAGEEIVAVAIRKADPAEFEAIWKKLGEADFPIDELRLAAIYHLAAGNDPAAAVRIARSLWFPDLSPEERARILAEIAWRDEMPVATAVAFLREVRSEEEWKNLAGVVKFQDSSWEQLRALKDSDLRLNEWETMVILKGTASVPGDPFTARSLEERLADYERARETVALLEDQGVLAEGARRMFLTQFSTGDPDVFFEKVPPQERLELLRMEGGEQVIGSIIASEYRDEPPALLRVTKEGGIPGYFFTATGITDHLPPQRLGVAVLAWRSIDVAGAEAWLAHNKDSIPLPQLDELLANIARDISYYDGEAKAKAWVDQIHDAALREETLEELKVKFSR